MFKRLFNFKKEKEKMNRILKEKKHNDEPKLKEVVILSKTNHTIIPTCTCGLKLKISAFALFAYGNEMKCPNCLEKWFTSSQQEVASYVPMDIVCNDNYCYCGTGRVKVDKIVYVEDY